MAQPLVSSSPLAAAKSRASIIEVVALIAVIILVFWFFVRPKQAQLSSQRAQLNQHQQAYDRVQKDTQDLTRLISQLNQNQSGIGIVDEALPLDTRITRLHILLDSLVNASGMKSTAINVIMPENVVAAGNKAAVKDQYGVSRKLVVFPMDMTVTGGIDQLKNLLQLIETNGRLVDITGITISNDQGLASYKIKLKSYSYAAS